MMHSEEPSWNEFKREDRLKHRLVCCRDQLQGTRLGSHQLQHLALMGILCRIRDIWNMWNMLYFSGSSCDDQGSLLPVAQLSRSCEIGSQICLPVRCCPVLRGWPDEQKKG